MKLAKRQYYAIELMIEGDLTMDEIAKCVKVSRRTLYNWLDDEDFKSAYDEQLNEIERKIRRRIANMADKALDAQERILSKSKNDVAAASVAADVLDRAGYKPDTAVKLEAAAPVQIINNIPRDGEHGG